jgi:putative glycosyltransferase (TIGR04372 family)
MKQPITSLQSDYPPGTSDRNPTKIVALINSRAVGDSLFYHVFCASVRRLFDHASLTVYQRDDRSYKRDLLEMNADKSEFIIAPPNYTGITIDSFQTTNDIVASRALLPPYIHDDWFWKASRSNQPHILLSPEGMPEGMLPCFDHPAFLRVPDGRVEVLTNQLVDHGIDPNRWFCVINFREPGYAYRGARKVKDLNPKPFAALVEYIIETLGGQVVRVGHPNRTPFPDRPGYADLATLEDSFMLHAFAITRARFLVGSLSGISHVGSAVNTPTLMTNCVSPPLTPGCWRPHDLILYLNLFDPKGRRICTAEQHEMGIFKAGDLIHLVEDESFKLFQNSATELALGVNELMESTMNCQAWREPSRPSESMVRPNRYEFPMPPKSRCRIVEYPDHSGRPS